MEIRAELLNHNSVSFLVLSLLCQIMIIIIVADDDDDS